MRTAIFIIWLTLVGGYVDEQYFHGRYMRQLTGMIASLIIAFQR